MKDLTLNDLLELGEIEANSIPVLPFTLKQEAEAVFNFAFLTGSRIYGQPRPDSDIDLVVRCDQELVDRLCEEFPDANCHTAVHVDDPNAEYPPEVSHAFRFGSLNLILVVSDTAYESWKAARDECIAAMMKKRNGITRDKAVEIHRHERRKRGLIP